MRSKSHSRVDALANTGLGEGVLNVLNEMSVKINGSNYFEIL